MLSFVKNLFMSRKRRLTPYQEHLRRESQKQKREGYKVEIPPESRGEYITYREEEKSLSAHIIWTKEGVEFYTDSLTEWETPHKGESLSPDELVVILKRICDYLSGDTSKVIIEDNWRHTLEEYLPLIEPKLQHEGWKIVKEENRAVILKQST
jgi:hypothetical protein